MNQSDLELLVNIYNTLLLVGTKGENTMIMGECLKALQHFILTKKQENENQEIKNKEV